MTWIKPDQHEEPIISKYHTTRHPYDIYRKHHQTNGMVSTSTCDYDQRKQVLINMEINQPQASHYVTMTMTTKIRMLWCQRQWKRIHPDGEDLELHPTSNHQHHGVVKTNKMAKDSSTSAIEAQLHVSYYTQVS